VSPVANAQSVTLTASAAAFPRPVYPGRLNATTPTLTVATSVFAITYGGAVTFTATVSSGPTGTVTFYDANNTVSVGTGDDQLGQQHADDELADCRFAHHHRELPGNSNYGAVNIRRHYAVSEQGRPLCLMEHARRHHLQHCFERDAIGCDFHSGRYLCLLARRRDGVDGRDTDVVCDLHAP